MMSRDVIVQLTSKTGGSAIYKGLTSIDVISSVVKKS